MTLPNGGSQDVQFEHAILATGSLPAIPPTLRLDDPRVMDSTAALDLPESDWARKAPVVYGGGQEPFPTSPDDILGWLRDHYREHIDQSAALVEEWKTATGA